MWPDKDGGLETNKNVCSDVVVMDDRAVATVVPPVPMVSTLNVTKSSKVHIGTKIVSVTQNVHNVEVIKELPLLSYLWNIVRNSSRTERLSCAAVLIVLITCIVLIVYFTTQRAEIDGGDEIPPHTWNITREMWLAQPHNDSPIVEHFLPLMLVVVQHTVSGECTKFAQCAAELRTMQGWFLKAKNYNIPYNFLIGNDGRVYEGRGWNKEGAHTFGYNRCSLGIGFIGDYREEKTHHSRVTDLQLNRTRLLLDEGILRGYLRPDFLIVGAKDVQSTQSPGSNLHNALKEWSNFDHQGRFRNMNCEQIQEKYGNVTFDQE